jgi:predicted porin
MMKKTLVALAATAATGAFAQVAITGNIDLGVAAVTSQTTASALTGLIGNGISTSSLGFSGSEDLGGGLRAGFKLETTLNANTTSGLDSAISTGSTAPGQFFSGTPFNSEQFISLSGGFGTVRAGVPNAAIFRAQGTSQPFGTALGSGYSGTFSRMGYTQGYSITDYLGTTNGAGSSMRIIRMQNTIQYETPNMNGLSGMVEYAFANDSATSTSAFAANSVGFLGLMVNYSAGPLTLSAAYNSVKSGTNDIAQGYNLPSTSLITSSLAANQDIAYQFVGGNYKMGSHTFYAGMTNVRASDATEDSQSWNLAYKFGLNQNVDLLANVVSVSTALTGTTQLSTGVTPWNKNAKMTAFGADYRFTKRTNAYVRYESVDTNTDNTLTGETNRTAIGIRHQF